MSVDLSVAVSCDTRYQTHHVLFKQQKFCLHSVFRSETHCVHLRGITHTPNQWQEYELCRLRVRACAFSREEQMNQGLACKKNKTLFVNRGYL